MKPTQKTESQEDLNLRCQQLEQEVESLSARLKWYEEQFRLSQQQKFGASREHTPEEQLSFFDEAEKEADPSTEASEGEEVPRRRKKRTGHRKEMLEDLPVERVEYTLEDTTCPQCEGTLHTMSQEVRKELKVIPAQVKVVEHIRHVYACRHCEQNELNTPVVTASMPASVLPGSFVSPSLMAYIMSRKYSEALPLYRQEQQLLHFGLEISRQTMANWMLRGANDWLVYVYQRLKQEALTKEVLHADETELQVLKEEGRTAANKSYMWLYATGQTDVPIYLYEYQTTRASKHPKAFLEGFEGFLHTDGYPGYNQIPKVTVVGCWAHARRKFTDALKGLKKEEEPTSHTMSSEGLAFCNQLFQLEREWKNLSPEERYTLRLEHSKPVLDAFLTWLKQNKKTALPKSPLGKAITYCLNQWPYLERILLDGRLEISNNRAERGIKPFCVGRKNWMFSNTPKGATASAMIFSIVETAKANGLSPFHYLTYLLEQLPNMDLADPSTMDALLPWSKTLPESCFSKTKNKD